MEIPTLPPLLGVEFFRATLVRVDNEDSAHVLLGEGITEEEVVCDFLHASATPSRVAPGDTVLVWRLAPAERGVILGRIGPSHAIATSTVIAADSPDAEIPDELVLEATHSLTLRVGDGSITIRADGKILIKGKDLVSHAKRVNRIRGGAVQIN